MWSHAYLVKVRLQKVHLRLILQQPWPEGLVEILLLQHHLDVSWSVVDLRRGGIDFGVELELDGVGGLLSLGVALECEATGLHVELDLVFRYIWYADRKEDVVSLRVGCA